MSFDKDLYRRIEEAFDGTTCSISDHYNDPTHFITIFNCPVRYSATSVYFMIPPHELNYRDLQNQYTKFNELYFGPNAEPIEHLEKYRELLDLLEPIIDRKYKIKKILEYLD